MSAWVAHPVTPQTCCRCEPKAFEPNLCRTCKSVLPEQTPGSTWLCLASKGLPAPKSSQECLFILFSSGKSPRKQSALGKLFFEERGRNLQGGWQEEEGRGLLTTAAGMGCRPQGVWGARTTLCRMGECHARTAKEWQVQLARWIPHGVHSSSLTSWRGGHMWS